MQCISLELRYTNDQTPSAAHVIRLRSAVCMNRGVLGFIVTNDVGSMSSSLPDRRYHHQLNPSITKHTTIRLAAAQHYIHTLNIANTDNWLSVFIVPPAVPILMYIVYCMCVNALSTCSPGVYPYSWIAWWIHTHKYTILPRDVGKDMQTMLLHGSSEIVHSDYLTWSDLLNLYWFKNKMFNGILEQYDIFNYKRTKHNNKICRNWTYSIIGQLCTLYII